jgi:hypothetical protein
MPQSPFEPSGYNCLTGLIGMGGFIAGIYHGLSDAKGVPMNPSLENTLIALPSIVGGFVGTKLFDRLEGSNYLPPIPPEAKGCQPVAGFIGGAVAVGAWNLAGYGLGRLLG